MECFGRQHSELMALRLRSFVCPGVFYVLIRFIITSIFVVWGGRRRSSWVVHKDLADE